MKKCDVCKREVEYTFEYYPHDDVCDSCGDDLDRYIYTNEGRMPIKKEEENKEQKEKRK
mgnify:CR=1 FL=1